MTDQYFNRNWGYQNKQNQLEEIHDLNLRQAEDILKRGNMDSSAAETAPARNPVDQDIVPLFLLVDLRMGSPLISRDNTQSGCLVLLSLFMYTNTIASEESKTKLFNAILQNCWIEINWSIRVLESTVLCVLHMFNYIM